MIKSISQTVTIFLGVAACFTIAASRALSASPFAEDISTTSLNVCFSSGAKFGSWTPSPGIGGCTPMEAGGDAATVSGTLSVMAFAPNAGATTLVQFLLDGSPLGAALGSSPFTLAWDTRSCVDGMHRPSAIARGGAGESPVSRTFAVRVDNNGAGVLADDEVRAPQKILTPSRADGINDAAVFGANAAEVSIYSLRGRLVFHASRQGGSPIVWNCRDAAGRVDESGVYIARVRTADAGILYQSFALAK